MSKNATHVTLGAPEEPIEPHVALPAERRHFGITHSYDVNDPWWARWRDDARAAGLGEELVTLGSLVMRAADTRAWCRALRERCGSTDESAAAMLRFALEVPERARACWTRLLATDGACGVVEGGVLRAATRDEFVREYSAFAIAFDAYVPADRVAEEDIDPSIGEETSEGRTCHLPRGALPNEIVRRTSVRTRSSSIPSMPKS